MFFWSLMSFLVLLMGLATVAFITLLERKILGLSQLRLGPNKVSMSGLFQPLIDGIKLMWKEYFFTMNSQIFLMILGPSFSLLMFITIWTWVMPWLSDFFSIKYSSLLFFSILGLSAYAVILSGWSTLSSFSKLGSLRGILQNLSFEVILIFIYMIILVSMKGFLLKSEESLSWEGLFFFSFFWLLLCLMETNRAPFDLLEGESELISGFNIELGGIPFVFLFLSEYGMMMTLSLIWSFSNLGKLSIVCLIFITSMLFIRSCFPRIRYDYMMSLMWLILLPLTTFYFLINLVLS